MPQPTEVGTVIVLGPFVLIAGMVVIGVVCPPFGRWLDRLGTPTEPVSEKVPIISTTPTEPGGVRGER